jgi:hypothetical protein
MENLAKAAGNLDPEEKAQAQDFVNRYTTGDPTQGYTDEEARQMAERVLPKLSPEQLQMALKASAANIESNATPNERTSLAEMMEQRKAGQGMVDITRAGENVEPGTTSEASAQAPGLDDLLGGLLGGLSGGAAAPSGGGGGLGDILGGLLGGGSSSSSSGGGGLGDILGGILGGATQDAPQDAPQAQPTAEASSGADITDMIADVMSSPMGKTLIAGAAAFAMKSILDGK